MLIVLLSITAFIVIVRISSTVIYLLHWYIDVFYSFYINSIGIDYICTGCSNISYKEPLDW